MQDFSLDQSFFQRYRGLCSLKLHVASGDHGKSFGVSDLELEDGCKAFNEARKESSVTISDIEESNNDKKSRLVYLPGWA